MPMIYVSHIKQNLKLIAGGAAVGAITGAIEGHRTETGLSRGFIIGALVGAVTGVQLMDLVLNGDPLPKVRKS